MSMLKNVFNWLYQMFVYFPLVAITGFLIMIVALLPGLIIVYVFELIINEPFSTLSSIFAIIINIFIIKTIGWWPAKLLNFLKGIPIIKYYANFIDRTFNEKTNEYY